MKIKARSGIVIWLTTFVLLFVTIMFSTMYSQFSGIVSYLLILIIMLISTLLCASFIVRNYLIVTEKTITICFGITTTILDIASLTSLKKVTNFMASASSSIKRIEIQYDGGIIYVSPKDEDKFIDLVCSYNPKIILNGLCV